MTERRKKHFSPESWVDFVNENLSKEQTEIMQAHLDGKCQGCSRMVKMWARVREAAQREARYDVPESAVRHVRSAFRMLAEPTKHKRFQIPRLVFDSLWQPAVAGVRSGTMTTSRQVLYTAGQIAIEMRLEPEPLSEKVNIAGQLSSAEPSGEGMQDVQVLVTGKQGLLAETKTNRFGEFQVSFVPTDGLRISFGILDGDDLSIPLNGRGVSIFQRN